MATPQVRRVRFDFEGDVAFCWQPANPEFALMMNMIGLMIIGFEKYIVDAVREAMPRIAEPAARGEADVFLRQEAQHARAHRMHMRALFRTYPGLKTTMDEVIADYDRLFAEKPLAYHLAYIADLEATFTPVFKQILDNADALFGPGDDRVASLFLWHFTEEIEHRSSALIIYDAVVPEPWYRLGQLPSVLRHMGKVMRITAEGINAAVPVEERIVDARNILPGRQVRRTIGEKVPLLAGDLDLRYPSAQEAIPQSVQLRTNLRILASQVPNHDPEHQPLPPFAAEWMARYERGDDVSRWFSSQAVR